MANFDSGETVLIQKQQSERSSTKTELVLIALTQFSLPMFEAPKNLFGVALLAVYLINSIRYRNFGKRNILELPVWGLIAVLAVSIFTSDFRNDINLPNESLRWTQLGLVVIVVGRLKFTRRQLIILAGALIAGGALAVADAFWLWSQNDRTYPEMRSVGHVNHSALYTLVTLAVSLGFLMYSKRWMQLLAVAGIASTLAFLGPSQSLVAGGTVGFLFLGFALLLCWKYSTWKPVMVATLLIIVVTPLAIYERLPYWEKFTAEATQRLNSADNFWSKRDALFYTAREVYDRHLFFGSGAQSYAQATDFEIVREEIEKEGRSWEEEKSNFFNSDHGHNVFLTILVERGLVGIIFLIAYLVLGWFHFVRWFRHCPPERKLELALSLSGLGILGGFLVAGLGNTTMQNEHGQAGMMMLAAMATYLKPKLSGLSDSETNTT